METNRSSLRILRNVLDSSSKPILLYARLYTSATVHSHTDTLLSLHRPCEGAVETALRITPKRDNRPEKHRIQEHSLFQNAAAGTKEHVKLGLQAVIIHSTSNAAPPARGSQERTPTRPPKLEVERGDERGTRNRQRNAGGHGDAKFRGTMWQEYMDIRCGAKVAQRNRRFKGINTGGRERQEEV